MTRATEIRFVVEGQPQAWERVMPRGGGVPFTPAKTRAYEKLVSQVAAVAAATQRWWLTKDRVAVELRAFFATRHRRDLDNVSKAVLDGITKSERVWADDWQVDDLRIVRGHDTERPRVEVHISLLPTGTAEHQRAITERRTDTWND